MPQTDFYPASMDLRDQWHQNFNAQLPAFATKYNIDAATLASVAADAAWYSAWVATRHAFDASGQQLTKYFNNIAGKDPNLPPPSPFTLSLPAKAPPEVPPGIEKRVRDLARDIKGRTNYSDADGELLGIVPPKPSGGPGQPPKPSIELTTRVAFEIGVKFRKFGFDGIRIEYRHQGGDWLPGGTLILSPGHFTVAPSQPNTPEQVEVRAVYLKGNSPTGDYSDTGSVYVGP